MKNFFILALTAFAFTACNNSAGDAEQQLKDSLDSIANLKKESIDEAAQDAKENIEQNTDSLKQNIDSVGGAVRDSLSN